MSAFGANADVVPLVSMFLMTQSGTSAESVM
jgi:hypothetical protein